MAYGRLSDLDDLLAHPQKRLIRVETENGPVELLSPGAVVSGQAERYGAVPGIGEQSEALRREFGARRAAEAASG